MSLPFIGEIKMFAGSFAPNGYAFADGQFILVAQNSVLFDLIGTTYGGDGQTTFRLPDLRGRVPVHMGTGPGLSPRQLGVTGGAENAGVSANQMPNHTHPLQATSAPANSSQPGGKTLSPTGGLADLYIDSNDDPQVMASEAISDHVGGGQSHENVQPFSGIHFIIALSGDTPT